MRRIDWVGRLWETVDLYMGREFEWGKHDCCLFSARCVDAVNGTLLTETLLAAYTDQATGQAFIDRHGNLESAVSSILGPPQRMAMTTRGQVALLSTRAGDGLGVCVGSRVAVASPGAGVAFYPYRLIVKSWPDP